MPKRMIAAIAALAFSAGAALAQEVKVGVVLPFTGIGAELGAADGPRHGALSQAQCRSGEALQDQAHQARLEGSERRRSQGRGPGTAHPGQGRCACRLGLFARCDRVGAGRYRRQEARGDHERRHRASSPIWRRNTCAPRSPCGMPATRWAWPPPRRCMRRPRSSPTPTSRPARTAWRRSSSALRGQWRQGDRRHSGGRTRRGAGLHAVLPARQGREAGRALRVRAGRRSRQPRWSRPTARSACARPASS